MFEISEYKHILGLILVTVLLVMQLVVPTEADGEVASIVIDKLAAISDKIPNKILGWDLNDMRPWRNALMAIMMQKRVYNRLKRKYKRQIRRNKRNQKKYRTIVPVSILPPILAAVRANRDMQSEYYFVGADDTVEPNDVKMPETSKF